MLWLTCPTCGHRSIEEFRFGGEPPAYAPSLTDPDAQNVDYVWMFENTRGVETERWFHEAGCRRWFTVERDTVADRFVSGDGSH
jgi:heterotetrameric sarcosine oxidase delta subunit